MTMTGASIHTIPGGFQDSGSGREDNERKIIVFENEAQCASFIVALSRRSTHQGSIARGDAPGPLPPRGVGGGGLNRDPGGKTKIMPISALQRKRRNVGAASARNRGTPWNQALGGGSPPGRPRPAGPRAG
jgi:hypothetical protein